MIQGVVLTLPEGSLMQRVQVRAQGIGIAIDPMPCPPISPARAHAPSLRDNTSIRRSSCVRLWRAVHRERPYTVFVGRMRRIRSFKLTPNPSTTPFVSNLRRMR
jgi:hypothetical protein